MTVQVAKLTGGAGFTPMLQFFAPDGSLLGVQSGSLAARLDIQAVVNGTFSVVVSDANRTGTGTYRLRLAQTPGSFLVPVGDEGGTLTNGANQQGVIDLGDLDQWSITANQGDWISVQIGKVSGGASFTPQIELVAPNGTSLAVDFGGAAARIDVQAEVGGTYTVLVSDATQIGAGGYELHLAQVPESFVVPTGDEGGTLTDGVDQDGNIPVGDIDLWTFTAGPSNRIITQISELTGGVGFTPQIELFGPDGARKGIASGASTATLDTAIEVGGTYTLLVSDATQIGTGTYRLHLMITSIVPPGNNALTNGATHLGSIATTGASNSWTFSASAGESIVLRVGEITQTGTFSPRIRLLNPSGVQQATASSTAAAEIAVRATNSGTFTAVIDSNGTGTGTYRLSLAKTGSPLVISPSDEGGALTNGATYLAGIDVGDIDAWSFTANAGESIAVWIGETAAGSSLLPWLRVFGPNGVQLAEDFNAAAAEVTVRATNSGTFLVVIGDGNVGGAGTGSYRLSMAKTGSPLAISPSDEGGALANGSTYLGSIDVGDIDAWTFTANAGESIVVWTGETTAGSSLVPWLRVFGPNGVRVAEDFNAAAAEVTVRATNSGTFLVVIGDGTVGRNGSGNYRLSLAKTGSPLVISPSDEGGALTNGTTYLGNIEVGDVDAWTFTASVGESFVVRVGETTTGSLTPWLRVFGPNGVQLGESFNVAAAEVTARATNSGTFLVVVGDGTVGRNGSGGYRLTLAKTGNPLVTSANDEGGSLTGAGTYDGTIEVGDLDVFTFTTCVSNTIALRVDEVVAGSTLTPWLRLYGRDGTLLGTSFGAATAQIGLRAPASGSYTVVVTDATTGLGGSGTYRLTVNGLSDGLQLCVPIISGTNLATSGVGGIPNTTNVLFTSLNAPGPLWTPIQTNRFDQYGVFVSTNRYDSSVPRQYFLLQQR